MKHSPLATIALCLVTIPALAQLPVGNANSYELDNGIETFATFVPSTTPTPGNEIAGDGIVNGSPANQMFWEILPKELMNAGNGTLPGSMELTSIEVSLYHSWWGISGGGSPPVIWDMSFHPVTYTNPVSGAGPDGRRYPNLAAPPILTLVGGQLGLPPPPQCSGGFYYFWALAFQMATATPGSGIMLPADGQTETAWCFWQPSGMSTLPADPTACEVGGNLSMMTMFSTNERVPAGITTGAATPAPTGVNRNPFHGTRTSPTSVNNTPSTQGFQAWPGFRDPVLQFRYFSTTTVPNAMALPERGSGALFMDATTAVTVYPGARTCATGHLGELVVHMVTGNQINFPPLGHPGIPVTGTSWLRLSPADPSFFLLTPAWDGTLVPNPVDYHYAVKHTYDAPLVFAFAGPIAPPGLSFLVQAFIVNLAAGPPFPVVSTNVAQGRIW